MYPCNVKYHNCIEFLKSRGIKVLGMNRYSEIMYRRCEKNIICHPFQIVEPDDLPEGFEVVYRCKTNGRVTFSYEAPIFCDYFYAMIFEKRERKTTDLITGPLFIH